MKAQVIVKRLLGSRLLRWAVVVLAVGIGGYEISTEWHQVSHSLGQIGVLASFEALLALFVAQFANLKVWQVLLAGLGSPLRLSVAGRILLIGQLGKYIPGSVWPVLTQMELGARANVPRPRSASASVLAMLLSLCVGLVVAMVTVPFAAVHSNDYLWVFVLVPLIAACFHPKVLNPLLNKLFKLAKRPALDTPINGRVLTEAVAWQLMAWIFQGLQIWILAEKFNAPMGRTALIALGGYAFAWCVGFVVVLAPAGAGIREVLLVAALGPVIGTVPATAVALVSRAVNTISDLLCAGAAVASSRRIGVIDGETGSVGGKAESTVPAETVTSASDTGPRG
jgi:glycosyltransferase 2 family protein